jgi:hypothetical protein
MEPRGQKRALMNVLMASRHRLCGMVTRAPARVSAQIGDLAEDLDDALRA